MANGGAQSAAMTSSSSATSAASSSRSNANVDIWMEDKPFEPVVRDPTGFPRAKAEDSILIDCGTSRWRAGFSCHDRPYIDEPSAVARYTSRKNVKTLLFGRDTEVDAGSRVTSRGFFEGEVMLGTDNMEAALDYTFLNLTPLSEALPSSNYVPHPIIMTERLGQPLHSRQIMTELLFEGYGVPSVTYGVDSLFAMESAWKRQGSTNRNGSGLVIDMGHVTTNVVPILGGKAILSRAKRIPFGGSQASDLMLRLAQLKYPGFPTRMTQQQATFLYHETAYFALDYQKELSQMSTPDGMAANSKVVQFEYTVPEVIQKSEEELARQAEKKREQGRRLQEMQAKQRIEKAAQREAHLAAMQELKASKAQMSEEEWQDALLNAEFEDEADLNKSIRNIESAIKKSAKASLDDEDVEEPTFPLLDVPDEELDDEQLKEKRKQRLAKAGYDARIKLRAEKQAEKERLAEEKRLDDETRERDPAAWAAKLRAEHEAIIERLKERKKLRAMLSDRKSAAAQSRMKSISNLANDSPAPKRRKKNADDDGFGADDADWAVYREIDGGEEEDAEEDDLARIAELETKLLAHDPTFDEDQTLDARSRRQTALINAFLRGETQKFDPEDLSQAYQLHLNVERIRVPETWFQPQMAGVDSAGIAEIAGWLLNGFKEAERREMMKCIFLTGGSSVIPNLKQRLSRELTALLPFREDVNIVTSWEPGQGGPQLDAWKGMSAWAARADEYKAAQMTKQEWEEGGLGYFKEHRWSNWSD